MHLLTDLQLFPHVKYVMDRFRHKLPKDVLKKHAKDVNKSLVASDYKHNRVNDPTSISDKTEKKVKKYVKDFLDKAVMKHREHEKQKAEREAMPGSAKIGSASASKAIASVETPGLPDGDDDIVMSDVEDIATSSPVKRKRQEDVDMLEASLTPDEIPSMKRLKEETPEESSPPPPPPPPPDAAMVDDLNMTASQVEEAFSLEQEEANRLADEAEQDRVRQEEALQRENEEAMREFELEQSHQQGPVYQGNVDASQEHEREQRSKQAILGQ